ncbi:MAG: DUF4125 family protein [Deltaproteobacteria bacterium]|nr:DUF4125 family protein [Deltaproteobacteria bacterium]
MSTPYDHAGKQGVIAQILSIELSMFLSVRSLEKASCQEDPERFKVMRAAQFSAWSEKTLESYLKDLKRAESEGDNLMTLKYARMDDLIPPLSQSPLIPAIVEIQKGWQRELAEKYPGVMGRGRGISDDDGGERGTSFERYLKGELETYSEQTLQELMSDAQEYLDRNENMAQAIYEAMIRELGYESLEEAEASIQAR